MAALLLATRLIYLALGLTFDASPAESYLQFIPAQWLEANLFQSIYYLHTSPPFLNLVTGIGLQWFGANAWVFYAVVWHLLAFVLLFSVFYTMKRLSTQSLAWGVTLVIAISPAFHLYGNWLMYTFPAACFLALSAALLVRFLDQPTTGNASLFFLSLALLVLTRSLFQLYWMMLLVPILFVLVPHARKQIAYGAVLPIFLCVCWYGKNLHLYDAFSASSLLGLSLNNVTTLTLPREALQPMVDSGELSSFAVVSRYSELGAVLQSQSTDFETGVPILDDVLTPNGQLNYNSLQMLAASRLYLQDSLTVLERYPFNYSLAMLLSHQVYFSPTSMNRYFTEQNLAATTTAASVFNRIAHGTRAKSYDIQQLHFGFTASHRIPVNPGILLIVSSVLILMAGVTRSLDIIVTRDWRTETIVFGYLLGNWLMVYIIGTYAELYENNRYRFIAEPFYWMLLVLIARQWWLAYRSGKGVEQV